MVVLSSILTIRKFSFGFTLAIFVILVPIGVIVDAFTSSVNWVILDTVALFADTYITFILSLSSTSFDKAYLLSNAFLFRLLSKQYDSNSVSIAFFKSFLFSRLNI